MSKEIPYQLSVNQLQDALDHIMRLAKASRSQTKRLKVIAARAETALNGEVYDGTNLKLPEPARAPMSYEAELRVTKRELAAALDREQALAAHVDAILTALNSTLNEYECCARVAKVVEAGPEVSVARIKDKAQYDLIDGLLFNHTQFTPESAGPIVELLLQIQSGLRPHAEGTCEEGAVA
ncbi:hypothetical protein L0636_01165 [Halomonas janggokensis]|uniref:Uncharacterized protein n=1 Tax=Vreelandella janggokensis TaxID=370767 RepID=A0ABT4ITE7_9GAMM|nr:hypothetical protein [Halomonas janggokensis]MCZ0926498.1 hypothetical protein [Halomonas janggokensis]MCZ0929036.1 hypothetical protein [Halomonas janggokensis]